MCAIGNDDGPFLQCWKSWPIRGRPPVAHRLCFYRSLSVKDQYVGDINDYVKFALLRRFTSAHPARLRVCWMLTPPDARRDGGKTEYLRSPAAATLDPALFDSLGSLVTGGRRTIEDFEACALLPEAVCYSPMLLDGINERSRYFDDLWETLRPHELVFFDPDNGLAVPSVPKGRRDSSKYLYWDEFGRALLGSRSVCVYQHFARRPRDHFISSLMARVASEHPQHRVFAVAGKFAVCLVCGPPNHAQSLLDAANGLASRASAPITLRVIAP